MSTRPADSVSAEKALAAVAVAARTAVVAVTIPVQHLLQSVAELASFGDLFKHPLAAVRCADRGVGCRVEVVGKAGALRLVQPPRQRLVQFFGG